MPFVALLEWGTWHSDLDIPHKLSDVMSCGECGEYWGICKIDLIDFEFKGPQSLIMGPRRGTDQTEIGTWVTILLPGCLEAETP